MKTDSGTPRTLGDVVMEHATACLGGGTEEGLRLLDLHRTQHYGAANLYLSALCIIRAKEREAAALRADCSAHAKARHDAELLAESLRAERNDHAAWRASLAEMLHQAEAEEIKLRADRDALAVALAECVNSCKASGKSRWAEAMRSPNPTIDGPKFERAENLLKAIAAHGGKP